MEPTYNWKNPTKSELWGDKGGNQWNYQPKGAITGIEVRHGDFIDSISFKSRDGDGNPKTLGGSGGEKKPPFQIDWPRDYLVSVWGTYDYFFGNNKAIQSICFKTHQGRVYKYGRDENGRREVNRFEFSKEGWMIVGFFGYHGDLLDGIGVYVKPIADVISYPQPPTPSVVPEQPPTPSGVPDYPPTPSHPIIQRGESRDFQAVQFMLKVEAFSLLPDKKGEKYESENFIVEGLQWRLILYPYGDKTPHGKDHISLYLALDESAFTSRGQNFTATVDLKFFVLNKCRNKYLTIRDPKGAVKKFHKLTPEQGFSQSISIETFKNPSNGYLVDDACVFGAELLLLEPSNRARQETLTMVKDPVATIYHHPSIVFKNSNDRTFTWTIKNFSKALLPNNQLQEASFTVAGIIWIVYMSPKGKNSPKGESLCLYLYMHVPERKSYVSGKLRVVNHHGNQRKEATFSHWFNVPKKELPFLDFMPISEILRPENQYLKDDTLLVQVEFDAASDYKIQ